MSLHSCQTGVARLNGRRRQYPKWTVPATLVLCLTLLADSARAQAPEPEPDQKPATELSQLTLQELTELKIDSVYGASRYTQKVTEAPASVTIITREEIRKYGHTTLADVLRSVRGFYVTYDRNYSYLGVRGFSRPGDYNARVLLLIDGHRLNDNIFGGALIGTEFPMDVDLIDRVEIIRGPSSSLYGTSAFFAVINVITRGADSTKGLEASASFGTFDTRKGRLSYGRTFHNGADVLLSGSMYSSEGERTLFFKEFDDPSTNNGIAVGADADQFAKVLGRVTFGNLTLQALYGAREKAIPTASFGTVFNDPRTRTIEKQGFIDLQYDRRVRGRWDLSSRLYYDRYGYDGDYVYDQLVNDALQRVVNKDFARGNWWGAEAKVSTRLARRHRLGVGAEYRDNVRQDQFNYDQAPFAQYLDDRRSSRNFALYAQDEISLHDRLMLNVGLRHDHYDSFGGTTNPRLGLIYNPLRKTTVKLLYGEAFRAPNAYELFWRQVGVTKPNPLLQPETNKTGEFVVERYVGNHVRVASTAFYYDIKGLISQETDSADDLLVYNNIDEVRGKGVELEAEGKWPSGLQSRVSYTLQNSRNKHTGMGLTNSPTHLAQFNLMTPLLHNGMAAGLEFQMIGKRKTLAGTDVGRRLVPNLTVVSRKLPRGIELSASIYNIANQTYGDPGSEEHRQDMIMQTGRTFRVKLTYRFPGTN